MAFAGVVIDVDILGRQLKLVVLHGVQILPVGTLLAKLVQIVVDVHLVLGIGMKHACCLLDLPFAGPVVRHVVQPAPFHGRPTGDHRIPLAATAHVARRRGRGWCWQENLFVCSLRNAELVGRWWGWGCWMANVAVSVILAGNALEALALTATLNGAVFVIWIARQGVGIEINIGLTLRLGRYVSKITGNRMSLVVRWRGRVPTVNVHRCELLSTQAEFPVQLMRAALLIRIGRRQVETFYRTSVERGLTVLEIVVAALSIDALHVTVARARWDLQL